MTDQGIIVSRESSARTIVDNVMPSTIFPLFISEPEISKWNGLTLPPTRQIYCIYLKDTFDLLGFNEFDVPMVTERFANSDYEQVSNVYASIKVTALELDYFISRFLDGNYLYAEMMLMNAAYFDDSFSELFNLLKVLSPRPVLVPTLRGEMHLSNITQFHSLLSGNGVLTTKEDYEEYKNKTTRRGTRSQLDKSIYEIKQMEDYQILKKAGWENYSETTQREISSMVRKMRLMLI